MSSDKTTILLTGASGTVGHEALKQLVAKDCYDLRVFSTRSSRARKKLAPFKDRVTIFEGDLTVAKDVEDACKGVDFVIHLAAIIPPLADKSPDLARRVNVKGTHNLVAGIKLYSPDAFFLYSSSISVYGDRIKDPWIKVGDPLQASVGDHYAETKMEAEAIIKESGLAHSVFRLTAIMGAGNHKPSGLMFHMPLNSCMEICTPEDTARACVHAVEHRESLNGKVFNLSGGENCRVTYEEFLRENFRIFGLGPVNFPENSFAHKNFHCGYYADGDDLEEILKFRKDDLQAYYRKVSESVPGAQRLVTRALSGVIKGVLVRQSEPLRAYKKNDAELSERFFFTEEEQKETTELV